MLRVCPVRSGRIFPLPLFCRITVGGAGLFKTLNRNVEVDVAVPSLTAIVISASPVCPKEGVSVIVRLASVPLSRILVFDMRALFEELAKTRRFDAAVSRSLMVNWIGGKGVSTLVV